MDIDPDDNLLTEEYGNDTYNHLLTLVDHPNVTVDQLLDAFRTVFQHSELPVVQEALYSGNITDAVVELQRHGISSDVEDLEYYLCDILSILFWNQLPPKLQIKEALQVLIHRYLEYNASINLLNLRVNESLPIM